MLALAILQASKCHMTVCMLGPAHATMRQPHRSYHFQALQVLKHLHHTQHPE